MRRWRSTLHENGVCIKSLCKLFIFSRRGAIFIAVDFSGLEPVRLHFGFQSPSIESAIAGGVKFWAIITEVYRDRLFGAVGALQTIAECLAGISRSGNESI